MSAKFTNRQQRLMKARSVLSRAENNYGLKNGLNLDKQSDTSPAYSTSSAIPSPEVLGQVVREAMGNTGWALIVGRLHIGWAAWAEAGVDLQRVLYLPDAEDDLMWVLNLAIGVVEIAVCDSNQISASNWRKLLAKARAQQTDLVSYSIGQFFISTGSGQGVAVA